MKKMLAFALTIILTLMGVGAFASGDPEPNIENGFLNSGEGWTSEVRWCKNGEMNIYGKFYFPADFDKTQLYPAVVMSHGFRSRAAGLEQAQWPMFMASLGYVSYIFEFCGGSDSAYSDGDFLEMSALTEVSDLNAVIDFVKAQPFIDSEHLFLLGQSMGGLVSALTAAQRPEDVKGQILLYPALSIPQTMRETVPDLEALTGETVDITIGMPCTVGINYVRDVYDMDVMGEIAAYTGDVLILHGTKDMLIHYDVSVEAISTAYAQSKSMLLLVSGPRAFHSFDTVYDEGRAYAQAAVAAFLEEHK